MTTNALMRISIWVDELTHRPRGNPERGVLLAEYGILIFFVGLAGFGILVLFGGEVVEMFQSTENEFDARAVPPAD